MIPPIFKDEQLQKQFDEQGFVKVPLLSDQDIQILTNLFNNLHGNIPLNSFGASSFINDTNEKLIIRDTLYPIFLPYFEKLFKDFTYFGSSFLYKTLGKNSDVSPHQDWTIVDEKQYVAINIWTPLIDTHSKNGTLYVVPGSQSQKEFTLRAPTIPFFFQDYFDTVIKCSTPTNAKAGEAVILNQSIIHYSSPNLEDDIRIAITSGLKSKDAPMLFHYKNDKNEIEQYEMPEDFLLGFNDFQKDIYNRPINGKYLSIVNDKTRILNKKEFLLKYATKKRSIWEKLFSI